MLLTQFILVDAHFVLSLLAALVFFAIAWLYFDAKDRRFFFGFLFLAVSFVAQAVIIDQALLDRSILSAQVATFVKILFRILGYLTLVISGITTPLQPIPGKDRVAAFLPPFALRLPAVFLLPILSAATGFFYLRRATVGLENHLKAIALGFFLLSLSELAGLSLLFRGTNNVALSNLVGPFGILWALERLFLLCAVFTFGKWVFGYLLKRFDTQLFMILTTSSLVIFLITTVFFTYATLNNLTQEAYDSLKTDTGVLNYSVESKKGELVSSAEVVAQNPELAAAIASGDKAKISSITSPVLLAKKESSLVVTGASGEILFKAEDPQFSGGSFSDNSLVKWALAGGTASGISTKDGVTAPVVVISAAVPVKGDTGTVGTVLVGLDIDNAFTDGIKSGTGLDTSIYAGNVRSATTFTAPDGVSRWVGIKEDDESINKEVLSEGKNFTGGVNILNVPYIASFSPLKDVDGNPVGMLFTGRPQVSILQTGARSLELTFIVTAILLMISLFPAYFVSRYISGQIR